MPSILAQEETEHSVGQPFRGDLKKAEAIARLFFRTKTGTEITSFIEKKLDRQTKIFGNNIIMKLAEISMFESVV